MNLLRFTNALSKLQIPDRPSSATDDPGLCIALIHGFAAREHMQRNLLRLLRESGYPNTTLYGHLQAQLVADELALAAGQGQPIVIIGYSQGGLEAVRVARELDRRGIQIHLLVTIAGGGKGGRFWPHRWADDPRSIPANVARCLNFFSTTDKLGTDVPLENNLAVALDSRQHVENICFNEHDRVSHLAITKCYPASRVRPRVATDLLQRIQAECAALHNQTNA